MIDKDDSGGRRTGPGKRRSRRIAPGLLLAFVALNAVWHPLYWLFGSPLSSGRVQAERAGVPHLAVVAHRGAAWWAPEETAPAYLLARELGVDYLEADVQRTADGVLVAFHDDDLTRTTDVAAVFPDRADRGIEAFTLDELRQLDAGSWFNEAYPERARDSFAGLLILTLEEMLDIAGTGDGGPGIYLEMKSPERFPGVEEDLVALLRKRGLAGGGGRVLVQSFDLDSLRRLQNLAPELPRVYLIKKKMVEERPFGDHLADAQGIAHGIGPSGHVAWPWRLARAHRQDYLVHVYTINEPRHMRLFHLAGADGFFTDRPELLLRYADRPVPVDPQTLLARLEEDF